MLALAFHVAASGANSVPLGRLPVSVVPTHVWLDLKIDPSQPGFSGTVRIDVQVAEATDTIWMHGRDLTIASATVTTGKGIRHDLTATVADGSGVLKLTSAHPIAVGSARIDIAYGAAFGQLQGAFHVRQNGDDYVLTQMEPTGARSAFPGFDEPGFKQPWDVTLTIPVVLQGVANTRQISETKDVDGWKKLAFATTERLPSYLIAFAVGPWDIVEGPELAPNAVRKNALRLRGIAARGQGERMTYALANTGAIVAAEEAYFGIAYPYDKLDILAAPDFASGAMENAGLIVYRDTLLFADDRSPLRQRQGYWDVHAHELAHQWFGDLVTMPWWDDVWLNEAFASWFALKVVGQLQPGFRADRAALAYVFYAMNEDSLAATRRVRQPISGFADIRSAFDSITYTKGAAVLGMFERYLGEDRFRDAIRSYLLHHAGGSATASNLIGEMASVSADPAGVTDAFHSFIDQPGVPMLDVSTTCADSAATVRIEQSRYLPVGSAAPKQGRWTLPMCIRYGDGTGTHEQCTLVRDKVTQLRLKTGSCPQWVIPNSHGAGYFRFAVAPADRARLEDHLDALDEREQLAYADSVDAAFVSGVLDSQSFLQAATRLASASEPRAALAPIARIEWMVRHLAQTPAQKQDLRDRVAALYRRHLAALGASAKHGETDDVRSARATLLSAMAYTARDATVRAELARAGRLLLGLSAHRGGPPGDGHLTLDAVPADQRGLALSMAMEEADGSELDVLLDHLSTAQDPELRGQLIGAAANIRNPVLLARARNLVLTPGAIRRNEIQLLLPNERSETHVFLSGREFIDINFDAIARMTSPTGARLVFSYAAGMCSGEEATALRKTFTARVQKLEGGPRALAQAIEKVELCAALAIARQGSAAGFAH